MNSAPSLAGRKRESSVWRYFTYDCSKDSSRCNIVDAKTKSTCVQVITGKNPTNLKKHVQACYPDVFNNLQQTESTRRNLKAKRLVCFLCKPSRPMRVLPPENFDFLDVRMCIFERAQCIIGRVYEKQRNYCG